MEKIEKRTTINLRYQPFASDAVSSNCVQKKMSFSKLYKTQGELSSDGINEWLAIALKLEAFCALPLVPHTSYIKGKKLSH